MQTKHVYIIASEQGNHYIAAMQKQSNTIIHCIVPNDMTMHKVYEIMKKIANDFCKEENSYGRDLFCRNSYKFTWNDFAEHIKNKHTILYDIEIIDIIDCATSVNATQNLVKFDDIFPNNLQD